ncbi:MAG: hypothetical protein K8R89_02990 [Anaerolineae bacterium]|nr:hypothetical protein [Anaerolineae bacterium]
MSKVQFQEVKSKITTTDWQVLGGLASFEDPLDFGNLLTITELSTFELEAALERLSVYSLVNTTGSSGPYSIYPLTRRFVLNELSSSLDGMRFISRNTFYVNVGRFLEQAGFVVRPMVDRLMYRCDNIPDAMRRLLPKLVYVHVTQSEVNANNILEIRREVQKIEPNAQVVLLVTDHSPTDQGWAQIGTLSMAGFKILPIERTLVQSGIESKHAYSLLLTEIEKRLGKDYDPYDVRDPVAGAFSFFGRDPFIEDVLRRSIERHPVGIFGLRKLGKSSVIQALRDRASFPVALVNLQLTGQAALEKVCKRILKQWSQWMQVHYDLDWQPPPLKIDQPMIGFIDAIANLLQSLESQKGPVRVGLFLDEIELLIPSAGDNQKLVRYLTFMRTLRGLVDEDDHFSFIVASLNPSVNRINAWNDEQNPTFNLFQEIYLPPLANDDCIQMVRNIGQQVRLSYSVDTLQIIVDLSGGHPFLARQFCSLLYKQRGRQPGQIEAAAIPAAVEHFIYDEQTVTHLDAGIWQDAGNPALWGEEQAQINQALLLELARADGPVPQDRLLDSPNADLRRTALINLERFHFIHQPEPGAYALRYGLLRTWLRRRKLGLE